MAEIIGIFYFTFSQEDRCLLSLPLPVEAEKIIRTMFSLNSNKAPDPDVNEAPMSRSSLE